MTEDEARTKWCPFARVAYTTGPTNDGDFRMASINRGDPHGMSLGTNGAFGINCIASECMAWRWTYSDPADAKTKGGILLPFEQWPGYCGLAGRPD